MSVDIPNYRMIEKLGIGAQSSIFRTRDMRTGRDYAVKVIKITKPEDTSFVDLLRSEYAIGSAIDHSCVRKVYELRMMRQRLRVRGALLFMEYVDGLSMSAKEFQRPMAEILRLFAEAAAGLHAMHLAGFVHADVKPNNIMVTGEGGVKLIDLGQSAKIREAKPRIQGTIDYMAPEQVQRGVLDQRTDVFGLGATLHKVLTGKPIATEMNQTASVNSPSLIGRRIDEMRQEVMHELPTCVARLIDDCCKASPADRIADMPALAERFSLAQTILNKQLASAAPLGTGAVTGHLYEPEHDDDAHADDHRADRLLDAIEEELGLKNSDDGSVDFSDLDPDK